MLVIAIIDDKATADLIPEDVRQQRRRRQPRAVAEQIKTKVLDAGVDGVILSPVTNLDGYHAGRHHRGRRDAQAAARRVNTRAATWLISPRRMGSRAATVVGCTDVGLVRRGADNEPSRSHRI